MNERRRTLLFSGGYKIPTENGIYIESVEHKFYLPDDWDSASTANSIAVVADEGKFRIALTDAPSTMQMNAAYEGSGTTIAAVAWTDYDGKHNTERIMSLQPSTDYAAGWCNAYTFPDGVTQGYLPALGELHFVSLNRGTLNTALTKCGGAIFRSDTCYWASTFYGIVKGEYHFWVACVGDNGYGSSRDYWYASVHPFAVLEDSN